MCHRLFILSLFRACFVAFDRSHTISIEFWLPVRIWWQLSEVFMYHLQFLCNHHSVNHNNLSMPISGFWSSWFVEILLIWFTFVIRALFLKRHENWIAAYFSEKQFLVIHLLLSDKLVSLAVAGDLDSVMSKRYNGPEEKGRNSISSYSVLHFATYRTPPSKGHGKHSSRFAFRLNRTSV